MQDTPQSLVVSERPQGGLGQRAVAHDRQQRLEAVLGSALKARAVGEAVDGITDKGPKDKSR